MDELASLLADLVRIDSVNPDLVPGAAGEDAIARFVATWLERAGIETTMQLSAPGRPNVIGRIPGKGSGQTLMLNAHLDTVGHAGMQRPLDPYVNGNRLYGRGAYDMKASLAAMMLTAVRLAANPPSGDVLITAVTDEEYGSLGTRAIVREYRADGAIVTEPTDLELTVAHKGFVWGHFETIGRAAHGSLPEEGVDAITMMGPILSGIHDLDQRLRRGTGHPLLATGSIHASLISGGSELSTYPKASRLSIERRTIPGETGALVDAEMDALLAAARQIRPDFDGTFTRTFTADSYEAPDHAPIRQIGESVMTDVLGSPPEITGVGGWMDSALLNAASIPTIIIGPAGAGAHADEEWVDLDSCRTCVTIYEAIAREFCA